jgi:glucokinase
MLGAVDIGGTKIAVGLVDDDGRLVAHQETPVCVEQGFSEAMGRVSAMLRSQIGIGCTGPIDPFTGRLEDVNTLPGWEGSDPVRMLSSNFDVSVAMENDADAAALAEAHWGSGKGKARFACITVGTGIGSALILDGALYRGADHSHPEFGHHILDPGGPLCTCGAYGCWEAMASGPALEARARKLASAEIPREALSAMGVCEFARKGEPWAVEAVQREGRLLGMGLANIITLFMPDLIALGGSVMKSADLLMTPIHEVIRTNCRLVPFEKCEVVRAHLGAEVGLLGAAQVWRHRFDFHEEGK